MEPLAIRIEDTGSVLTMYNEDFGLEFLGNREIERVTEIWFDTYAQKFYVQHVRTEIVIASGFDTYSAAVAHEKEWFRQLVSDNRNPLLEV